MIEILSLSKRLPHMLTLLTQRLVPIKEVFGIGFDLDLVQPSFTRFRYPLRCFIGICLSLSSPLFTKSNTASFLPPTQTSHLPVLPCIVETACVMRPLANWA